MTETSILCPSCNASYRRGSLAAGARVTCKKCGTAFVVDAPAPLPDEPEFNAELEDAEPEDAAGEPEPRGTPRRAGGRREARTTPRPAARTPAGGARRRGEAAPAPGSRRRGAAAPSGGKGKIMVLAGAGVAVIAVSLFLAFGTGGGEPGGGSQASEKTAAPPVKTGKDLFDDLLGRARGAQVTAEKQRILEAAFQEAASGEWPGADEARKGVEEEILLVDPDNVLVRAARDEVQYKGRDEEWQGKWVSKDRVREIDVSWLEKKTEEEARAAAEAEEKKWDKDAWTRRARRVSERFAKLMPEGMKLKFIFDRELVKRPYFLMVEDVPSPDPIATADTLGPGLAALRHEFQTRYKDILAGWDEQLVVPVMCFANVESYKLYRKDKPGLPTENLAAAFYVSFSESPADYKGTLYVWQGEREKYFHEVLFHEATHQLMHNACSMELMGRTPWLQEGIAEFFGAYEGNHAAGYTFGHVQESRTPHLKRICREYFDTEKEERQSANPGYLTPRQLVKFDRMKFERLKAGLDGRSKPAGFDEGKARAQVGQIYAEGWALIHFCYQHENGKYRKPFEQFLAKELRYEADFEAFEEVFGIKSDEDWAKLADEFFTFCFREYR